jgi:hypothetical protein
MTPGTNLAAVPKKTNTVPKTTKTVPKTTKSKCRKKVPKQVATPTTCDKGCRGTSTFASAHLEANIF